MKLTNKELNEYLFEVASGHIKMSRHPKNNNIAIFNYTDKTVYEKRWNRQTMTARGLIVDLKNFLILAQPFEKFPNYNSNEIEGYEDDLSWDEVDVVMEKMDGSLGITYMLDGEFQFSTRGSLDSDQSHMAKRIWSNKYKEAEAKLLKDYGKEQPTLLFEIIYPQNRVVVDYGSKTDLILIGVNYKGHDFSYNELEKFSTDYGLNLVKSFSLSLNEMLSKKETMSANEEGFIVRFKNGKRLKIKGTEYLNVHRIKHGMSIKAKYKAWSESKLSDYIMQLPEEFREELELFGAKLDNILLQKTSEVHFMYNEILSKIDKDDKSAFGKYVSQNCPADLKRHMFTLNSTPQDKSFLDDLRMQIYKNYAEYEAI